MAKQAKRQRDQRDAAPNGICFEPLEPRLLLSGSWGAGAEAPATEAQPQPGSDFSPAGTDFHVGRGHADAEAAHPKSPSVAPVVDLLAQAPALNAFPAGDTQADAETSSPAAVASRELVFVDAGIQDYARLVDDLLAVSADDRDFEIIVLDAERDGIAQISEALADRQDLDAVHFVTHGSDGAIQLGGTLLSSSNLEAYEGDIAGWQAALAPEADLLFYGCELAGGGEGQALLETLGALTGADVAASDDLTGSARLGGDWDLEYRTGNIEAGIASTGDTPGRWSGLLGQITVTTTTDNIDPSANCNNLADLAANPGEDGEISLREAIEAANNDPDADTIFLQPGTYTLSGGDLVITEDLSIRGANPNTTVVDGNAADRIFTINNNSTATLSGITIRNGNLSHNSGGVFVESGSTLNLSDAIVRDNTSDMGGGIHVHGTANLDRVLLMNNTATNQGGAIHFHSADGGSLNNVTISGNTASTEGGGLWTDSSITISNVTIADNSAVTQGGGMLVAGGTVDIANSIVADNTAGGTGPDVFGTLASSNANIFEDASGFTITTGAFLNADPLLGGLADNGGNLMTHAPTSPLAIDGADRTLSPTPDQRGFLRNDGSPDIGAHEVGAGVASTAHYLDQFILQAYDGDDGTLPWSNDWQEVNEVGPAVGPANGDIKVFPGLGDQGINIRSDRGAWREADLSGATSALLSFDYARLELEANDHLVVYIQTAGMTGGDVIPGAPDTWDEIARYSGAADDSAYLHEPGIDISAYVAPDTRIMFLADGATHGNDNIYVDNVRIDLATATASLWMSTTGNVGSSGAPGLGSWDNDEVIALGDPNLQFAPGTTSGEFSSVVNLKVPAGTDTDIDALHHVTRTITLGTTHTVILQPGDVLFSTNGPETIQSLPVARDDIMRFRPDTPGDYSSGTFAYVLRGPLGGVDLKAFSLIEQSTPFGDTTLNAGDFLFSQEVGNGNDVYLFRTAEAGNGTTAGTVELAIRGSEVGVTEGISGLELLETNTILGDETLAAGELLVSVDASDSGIGTSGITAEQQDIFHLQIVKTNLVTGTAVADAAMLMDGSALNLLPFEDDEDIDALTVVSSGNPAATPSSQLTVTTADDVADGDTSSVGALIDNPGADGYISLREAIIAANSTDGLNRINFNIAGSGPHTISLAPVNGALPYITGTVVIDGTSEPDFSNAPVIQIDGAALSAVLGDNYDALRLTTGSDGSTIRGLSITNFSDGGFWGDAFDIRSDFNTIAGNYLGIAPDGTTVAGNETGITLNNGADFNTIGGTTAADRNYISGNRYSGVSIIDNNTNDNRIIGNWIGLDVAGDVVSAGDHGVVMWDGPYNNQIGGVNPGEGNRIAGHNNGVNVDNNGADSLNNAILGNEIFAVNEMAIDLDNDQITANDAGDGDSGPNDLLNHPVLTLLNQNGADLEITFDLDVPAGSYRIEFFDNPAGIGGMGLGEGQVFLGAVTVAHTGGGAQSFSDTLNGVTATAIGSVTATATEDLGGGRYGGTSEFCAPIAQLAPVLTGANDLTPIDEDPSSNPGTLVSDLIAGQVSDPNPGALAGIAVIAVDDANGTWAYSINGGTNWLAFGAVDASSARLLAADAGTLVRFVPDPNWNGTVTNGLTFHAWDQTSGSNGGTADLAAIMDSVRDAFNAVDYANNDGSTTWAGSWVEENDDGWADTGQVQITGGVLRLDNHDGGSEERVSRAVDLSGATAATLSFDFQILGGTENPDRVRVQVSDDGGTNWTTLETFFGDGPTSGSRSYDIAGFATADTQIRFRISNEFFGFSEYFAVDNVAIDYTVDSSGGNSAFSIDAASSSVTVNPVNDAPTLTAFSNVVDTTSEDTEVEITFDELRTWGDEDDIDGTVDAFVVKSVSSGTLRIGADAGSATAWALGSNDALNATTHAYWTPDFAANGTLAAFEVVAEDNEGAESPVPVQVDVEVTSVNNAPTLGGGPFTLSATDEDTTSVGTQVATILGGLTQGDADGDTLGLAIEAASGNGSWQYSIDSTDGTNGSWTDFGPVNGSSALLLANNSWVRYQPDLFNGESVGITFHAWDGSTDSASTTGTPAYANPGAGGGSTAYSFGVAQATLIVTDLDDMPVITGDVSGSVTEDDAPTLTASGDLDATGGDAGEDLFNAETLTGTYGDLTVTAAGGWTYSADNSQAAIQALALSDTQTETFTVTNADGVTTQTVTITINGDDDVPVITGDVNGSVTEDDAATLTASGDLDASGGDAGEDLFNAETLTGTYGDLTVTAAGGWTYSADNSQAAIQALGASDILSETFTVTNADDATTTVLTITINGTNDAPVAVDDAVTATEDTVFTSVLDLDSNDTDLDGDTLSVVGGTFATAQGGSLVLAADGSYTYTPPANFNGTDTVDYTVTDGSLTDTGTLTITVDPVNDAPTAAGDSFTVDEGASANLDLAGNDSDGDDGLDLGSIAIVSGPGHGTIDRINADGTIDYTHDGSENFTDSFTYTIDDMAGATSNTVTVSLTITPVSDNDPVADNESFTVTEGGTATHADLDAGSSLLDGDTDADLPGDTLTVSTAPVAGPSHGSLILNSDGTFSYTHDGSENFSDSFTYRVSDGAGNSATATVSITITPVNDAPRVTLNNVTFVIPEDTDTSAAIKVADIVIVDDAMGTNTLSLGGADAAMFEIVGGSELYLRAGAVLDAGSVPLLDVSVTVNDTTVGGTPDDAAALSIAVNASGGGISPPEDDNPPEVGDTTETGTDPVDEVPEDGTAPEESPLDDVAEAIVPPMNPEPAAENGAPPDGPAGSPNASQAFTGRTFKPFRMAAVDLEDLAARRYDNAYTPRPADADPGPQRAERLVRALNRYSARAYLNLMNSLNDVKEEMVGEIAFNQTVLGSAIVMSTGLSVGYVIWLVRGGMLLSSLLSSLPAWQILDPLPILARKKDGDDNDDDESLESILNREPKPPAPKTQPEDETGEARQPGE